MIIYILGCVVSAATFCGMIGAGYGLNCPDRNGECFIVFGLLGVIFGIFIGVIWGAFAALGVENLILRGFLTIILFFVILGTLVFANEVVKKRYRKNKV